MGRAKQSKPRRVRPPKPAVPAARKAGGYTRAMVHGIQCVTCRTDFRTGNRGEVVIGHYNGGEVCACPGECARAACGHPEGLPDEGEPLDIEDRLEDAPEEYDGDFQPGASIEARRLDEELVHQPDPDAKTAFTIAAAAWENHIVTVPGRDVDILEALEDGGVDRVRALIESWGLVWGTDVIPAAE